MTDVRPDAEERRRHVEIRFEGNRLSGVYLAEAYGLVAPQRRHLTVSGEGSQDRTPGTQEVRDA